MDRFGQDRCRRIFRRLVIFFLLLGMEVRNLSGQGMEWSISPSLPQAGDPFTLNVRFPIPEQLLSSEGSLLDVIPPKESFLPSSIQLFKGPLVQTRRERAEGRLSTYLLVTYICVATRAGRFRLDPIRIQIGEREYRVESFLVEVAQKDPPHRVPFELDWIIPKGPFYVGQAIPLKLVAKDLKVLKEPEAVQVESTSLGILEKATDFSGEEPEKKQDGWVFRTIGRYLYTPYREGSHSLPSVTVTIEGIGQKLEGTEISILPVPSPVRRGSGAVGSFSAKASLDQSTIPMGETTTLRIRIEGRGNLHWIKGPSIQLEECSLIYEGRNTYFRPTWEGFEGWIEEAYRVVPERAGSFAVRVQPFFFWNPLQQRIQNLTFPPLSLQVQEPQKEDTRKNVPTGRVNLDILPESAHVSGWTTWLYRPGLYFLFLPAIFGMLGNRIWKKGRYVLYLGGWFFCLGVLFLPFSGFQRTDPSSSQAIREFNKGVGYEREGQWQEALFHLRKAVYLSSDPQFRKSVQKVEETYGLAFRAPLPRWVPDRWFLMGIGAFHLIAIGSMMGNKRGITGWILGIGISALLLASVGLYHSLSDLRKPWGMIMNSNVVLHKVPSASSQEGVPVPSGSCFYVGREKGDYVFVFWEGVKGWVEKKYLRRE